MNRKLIKLFQIRRKCRKNNLYLAVISQQCRLTLQNATIAQPCYVIFLIWTSLAEQCNRLCRVSFVFASNSIFTDSHKNFPLLLYVNTHPNTRIHWLIKNKIPSSIISYIYALFTKQFIFISTNFIWLFRVCLLIMNGISEV